MATATTIKYEPVIGLEVHVQLKTKTKAFCSCKVEFGAPANSHTCPVCLGLPGALPVLNKEVVTLAIKVGLALNCQIAHRIKFDRKNYFYPDLPKGYQITQYDGPICFDGILELPIHDASGAPRNCRVTRAHLEEDAGKSIHLEGSTLIDLNRAGTALVEIVSAPDLRSAEEAHAYLTTLKRNLSYLDVSELSMEKGSLRCDANISIKPEGAIKLGTRVEVKNMNSFKSVASAIRFEIERQTKVVSAGGTLHQETRLWDEDQLCTRAMRSKEEANDYRYFPEPDLSWFNIDRKWVEQIQSSLPELPEKRLLRFLDDYKLERGEAEFLVSERELAEFFEHAVKLYQKPRKVAAWVAGEFSHAMQERAIGVKGLKITPAALIGLMDLLDAGKLNNVTAKEVFAAMLDSGEDALAVARRLNKLIEQDSGAVDKAIIEVMLEFADKAVADYKAGKDVALGFLVGQVVRKLKGKANPKEIAPLLTKAIRG
ncbi:MAG: Asp-tRNA(Asn)/Glu-tRNA(Gln) amidotransferase subunit GatB [Planctomycetes bacterium]|nr:Asp-tRNA(Asn)/Glu-tRNA(Gln) amidotransferase subunit GatB [Planctomycetota bacterium]